jgi:hypothetical protein
MLVEENTRIRTLLLIGGFTIGFTTGTLVTLKHYVQQEIYRRGYPSWEECRCDFKTQPIIFQVWHSRNRQQGETIVSQEWGMYLVQPPRWLRHLLHSSAQTLAIMNPRKHQLERVTLSPQESYQFASLLHARTTNEDLPEPPPEEHSYIAWRRENLHFPRYLFDVNIQRLYPAHIAPERLHHAEDLPVLWDQQSNLPLPTEGGALIKTPIGTHIDYIGWSPTQISYCTARIHHNSLPDHA